MFTVAFRGVDLTVLRNLVNFDGGYSSSRIQTSCRPVNGYCALRSFASLRLLSDRRQTVRRAAVKFNVQRNEGLWPSCFTSTQQQQQ